VQDTKQSEMGISEQNSFASGFEFFPLIDVFINFFDRIKRISVLKNDEE